MQLQQQVTAKLPCNHKRNGAACNMSSGEKMAQHGSAWRSLVARRAPSSAPSPASKSTMSSSGFPPVVEHERQ